MSSVILSISQTFLTMVPRTRELDRSRQQLIFMYSGCLISWNPPIIFSARQVSVLDWHNQWQPSYVRYNLWFLSRSHSSEAEDASLLPFPTIAVAEWLLDRLEESDVPAYGWEP